MLNLKKKFLNCISIIIFAFLMTSLVGCGSTESSSTSQSKSSSSISSSQDMSNDDDKIKDESNHTQSPSKSENSPMTGELKVHFIDVGQADSILIQQGSHNMLIDAGNNADESTLKSYLSSQGITEFKYVIGTHAHEDHIGSLDYIINSFKVDKVYFPKQSSTTKTFENFINAVKNKGLKLTAPSVGETFNLGDAKCTILAPIGSGYEDANDYSIVLKVQYGNTSYLFTGDAESLSESEMLNKGLDLKADVLKVGHHGSSSSTSENFLSAVNPKYAVISVGKDNSYGHPSQSAMDRLKARNIPVFRTDESGTIVSISDGNSITFDKAPGSYDGIKSSASNSSTGDSPKSTIASDSYISKPSSSNSDSTSLKSTTTNEPASASITVYWTPGGKSYHYNKNCSTLSRSKVINEGNGSQCPKTDPCNKCVK